MTALRPAAAASAPCRPSSASPWSSSSCCTSRRAAPGARRRRIRCAASSGRAAEEMRRLYGLDRPLPEQFAAWIGRVARLDLGESFVDHRPVSERILEALPHTLAAERPRPVLRARCIAIPLGVVAGRQSRGRLRPDLGGGPLRAVLDADLLGGAPAADALRREAALASALRRSPSDAAPAGLAGLSDRLAHLALPVTCLTYGTLAFVARLVRSGRGGGARRPTTCSPRAPAARRGGRRSGATPSATRSCRCITLFGLLLPALLSGQRHRREDLRVAGPRPPLPRLDPRPRLPGDPGALAAVRGGDAARHARLRHRRSPRWTRASATGRRGRAGRWRSCPRAAGACPRAARVALAVVVVSLGRGRCARRSSRERARSIRLDDRLQPPSLVAPVRHGRPRPRPAGAHRDRDADLARDRARRGRRVARRRIRGRARRRATSAGAVDLALSRADRGHALLPGALPAARARGVSAAVARRPSSRRSA